MLSGAASTPEPWGGETAGETIWPVMPEMLTLWLGVGRVCQPLLLNGFTPAPSGTDALHSTIGAFDSPGSGFVLQPFCVFLDTGIFEEPRPVIL